MTGTRFCPNCGSTSVEPDTSIAAEMYFSGGNPNKWSCNECGFTGFMPEVDKEEFDPEEAPELEFDQTENGSTGDMWFAHGYFSYFKYIELPVFIAAVAYIIYRLLIQG